MNERKCKEKAVLRRKKAVAPPLFFLFPAEDRFLVVLDLLLELFEASELLLAPEAAFEADVKGLSVGIALEAEEMAFDGI